MLFTSALAARGSTLFAAENVSATNQVRQISIGDSVQAVQKALETDSAPTPTSSVATQSPGSS